MRPHKQYEVALMKFLGSSEGVRPKYTCEQEEKLGLETNNWLVGTIDYPIAVTISARKDLVSEYQILQFCLLAAVMGEEATYSSLLGNILDCCNKFKATNDHGYALVAKHSDSKYFITIEGKHEDVLSHLGLSLQALEMRTAGN